MKMSTKTITSLRHADNVNKSDISWNKNLQISGYELTDPSW